MRKERPAEAKSPLEKIDLVNERAHALRAPYRWMVWIGGGWISVVLTTAFIKVLAEAFTGRQVDVSMVLRYEFPLILPLPVVAGWWVVKAERFRNDFRILRGIFVPGRENAREVAPPSAIGPLLEGTIAEAAIVGMSEADGLMVATALLTALLQSLRPEDEVVLTLHQRERLHEIIMPPKKELWFGTGGVGGKNSVAVRNLRDRLRPTVVGAMGMLGNSSSIPLLERFAATTQNSDLRASALHALELVRERVRYGPEQMLRASETPKSPDILLRAAEPDRAQQSESQQLLRAGSAVSEEDTGR